MRKGKDQVPLEDLTKEQLVTKCKNQRKVINTLTEISIILKKRCEMYELVMSRKPLEHKLNVCFRETLSYMDEIEQIKQEKLKEKEEN